MSRRRDASLVYSSERGSICRKCGRPTADCRCAAKPRGAPAPTGGSRDRVVRVQRESKGRRGKTVTTLSNVALSDPELRALARELKQLCGSGGSVKEGVIEIQGDHRELLIAELEARGFQAKRAGG